MSAAAPPGGHPPPGRRLPTPSVGRVVHYQAPGDATGTFPPACRSSTITEVGGWVTIEQTMPERPDPNTPAGAVRTVLQRWDPEACGLHVANPTGVFFKGSIPHHEPGPDGERTPISWHWPEQV